MSKLPPAKELGATLVRLRKARGWDQREFARRLGKTQPEVSRWERGHLRAAYDTVVMWSDALGVPVGEFLRSDDSGEAEKGQPNVEERTRAAEATPTVDALGLRARLDLIEALDVPESTKIMKMEVLATIVRWEAMREAEAAAKIRAEALRHAEVAAEQRARATRRAEATAAARARSIASDGAVPRVPAAAYRGEAMSEEAPARRGDED